MALGMLVRESFSSRLSSMQVGAQLKVEGRQKRASLPLTLVMSAPADEQL